MGHPLAEDPSVGQAAQEHQLKGVQEDGQSHLAGSDRRSGLCVEQLGGGLFG